MIVVKFGGTSVANSANILAVIDIIRAKLAVDQVIVVVSALGGVTDQLIEAGKLAAEHSESYKEKMALIEQQHLQTVRELIPIARQSSTLSLIKKKCNELESICDGVYLLRELSARTLDSMMSYGEILSSLIVSAAFTARELENQWIDSRNFIRTNSAYGAAIVNFPLTNQAVKSYFTDNIASLYLVPGFIASDPQNITTTLGRGGSDYTAAILAAALETRELEIWTDVSGMMTADPRLVSSAKVIPFISYQEAMELSHFGAKVIYPPTIQPVMSKGIKVWIKNTFSPEDHGTLIENNGTEKQGFVRGISSIGHIALMSLEGSGMVGVPGISSRLFQALSAEKINVILITQGSSEHSICFAIDENMADTAKEAVDSMFAYEIATSKIEPLKVEIHQTIVALVGDNMNGHPGISGKMFGTLGRNGVNIRAIAQGSSEKNISAVISSFDEKKAVNVLHEAFFETVYKQMNLFIVGVGNVGSRFLEQLFHQQKYLYDQMKLQVRVVGLANSQRMIFAEKGLDLQNWREELTGGEGMQLDKFIEFILKTNLRNSVFVDITASDNVAASYKTLLMKSISVVACNKIASSSTFQIYNTLKTAARDYNALYLFETNVGAGLPIIHTLNDLTRSGDKLTRIEAVLSGTLNYVFNNYNTSESFADVVRRAQSEGYTEPDPRIDLSGIDVMRKILILARESGLAMELDEIRNQSFLPPSCMEGSVPDFYRELETHEAHFASLYHEAASQKGRLRFVATLEDGIASVGLQTIPENHNLYNLFGKDNIVLFYTQRYPDQPLVVKGAGAGAEVTASGIFADVIRAARL